MKKIDATKEQLVLLTGAAWMTVEAADEAIKKAMGAQS